MSNEAPADALRLVPIEPTAAMMDAAFDAFEINHPMQYRTGTEARKAIWSAMLAAAPASPLPGGGQLSKNLGELDPRIKSEMDFIKDIAANVQRDLAELEDGFSKSQRTAKTDRAVTKMRERCAVLIQCADDALAALPAAPTGDA